MQHIHIRDESAFCSKCGADLLDIANFMYVGKTVKEPLFSEELCECRRCHNRFWIRYDIYDAEGHINREMFTGDPNDLNYSFWQANLSDEQKKLLLDHFSKCPKCQDSFNEEVLADSWFADFIHSSSKSLG